MRVIVPFTDIHPCTERALASLVPDVQRVDVGGDPLAYSRLLAELWASGDDFLVVEHDIQLTAEALRQAGECDCVWSTSPYRGAGTSWAAATLLTRSLGCTRFRGELTRRLPTVVAEANARNDMGSVCPPGHWKGLDARLYSVLRGEGLEPHLHAEVPHHHLYSYGCACGGDHG